MVVRTRVCSFFFSSRRRHTRCLSDWSSDVCSSDLWPSTCNWGRAACRQAALPGRRATPWVPLSVRDRLDFYVSELNLAAAGILLQANHSRGVLGVRAVQDYLAVQHDDEVVAVSGDLVAVPLIRQDLSRCRFDGIHQGAGLVSRPKIPNLQLITGLGGDAARFLRAEKNAAIGFLADPELNLQVEIAEHVVRAKPFAAVAVADDGAIGHPPRRSRWFRSGGRMRLPTLQRGTVEQQLPAGGHLFFGEGVRSLGMQCPKREASYSD